MSFVTQEEFTLKLLPARFCERDIGAHDVAGFVAIN